MRQNYGNAIPVYSRLEDQMRFNKGCSHQEYGLSWTIDNLPPFQWPTNFVPGGGGPVSRCVMVEVDTGNETSIQRNITYNGDGSKGYFTFPEGGIATGLGEPIPCGFVYLRLEIAASTTVYTDVFHLKSIASTTKDYYRLRFKDTSDKDSILYTQGYEQAVMFSAVYDFQQTVVNREISANGLDEQQIDFSSRKVRQTLIITNFPGYLEDTFQSLTEHDYIRLENVTTGEIITLTETEFITEPQDNCFYIGRLSWLDSHMVDTACDVAQTITDTQVYNAS